MRIANVSRFNLALRQLSDAELAHVVGGDDNAAPPAPTPTVQSCTQLGLTDSTMILGSDNNIYDYNPQISCPDNGANVPDGASSVSPNQTYHLSDNGDNQGGDDSSYQVADGGGGDDYA